MRCYSVSGKRCLKFCGDAEAADRTLASEKAAWLNHGSGEKLWDQIPIQKFRSCGVFLPQREIDYRWDSAVAADQVDF